MPLTSSLSSKITQQEDEREKATGLCNCMQTVSLVMERIRLIIIFILIEILQDCLLLMIHTVETLGEWQPTAYKFFSSSPSLVVFHFIFKLDVISCGEKCNLFCPKMSVKTLEILPH